MYTYLTHILTFPGTPIIYYGDEIGMRWIDNLPSKEGGYLRTGSRTPMQWDDTLHAGFSNCPEENLYLPLDPDLNRPSVSQQQNDDHSLLHHVQQLTSLRRALPALHGDAGYRVLYAEPHQYPFIFLRYTKNQRLVVAINPSSTSQSAHIALDGSQVF